MILCAHLVRSFPSLCLTYPRFSGAFEDGSLPAFLAMSIFGRLLSLSPLFPLAKP